LSHCAAGRFRRILEASHCLNPAFAHGFVSIERLGNGDLARGTILLNFKIS
jgi:hypothetical protein